MSNIKVNDLKPAGTDLFYDSESFMKNLGEDELSISGSGFFNGSFIRISWRGTLIGVGAKTIYDAMA